MRILLSVSILLAFWSDAAHVGSRPSYLVDKLKPSPLKQQLNSCIGKPVSTQEFSIAHRGAPLQFPEHTRAGYLAAIRQGAGILECDVTFTKDKQLVCRHDQCDLHQTTDILTRPELAKQCTVPFTPATSTSEAVAKCCTSDFTLAQLSSVCTKMDGANNAATNVEDYLRGTPPWRTELYQACETVVTHKESIQLFQQHAVKMIPELKQPQVTMPFDGNYHYYDYANQLIQEYVEAEVAPENVFLQSFDLDIVNYWLEQAGNFSGRVIFLDDRLDTQQALIHHPEQLVPTFAQLKSRGLKGIAPPLWVLVHSDQGVIKPTRYALAAKEAGLTIYTWTLERSGPIKDGGGWYYQSIADVATNDGVVYELLDVLARQVGVEGVFSDWPATTSFYANCMALP